MMDIHQVFCTNLSKIRSNRRLTQQEMADKLNVSLNYYQQLEYGYQTGRQWPRPEKIKRLAKTLKCKPTDFFKEI
jgi:transcriptional regulator with XRE-family HTH domain